MYICGRSDCSTNGTAGEMRTKSRTQLLGWIIIPVLWVLLGGTVYILENVHRNEKRTYLYLIRWNVGMIYPENCVLVYFSACFIALCQ